MPENWTEQIIQELIGVPKLIVERDPQSNYAQINQDWRSKLTLVARDGNSHAFEVFIRQNVRFPNGFSVGLRYKVHDGNLTTITLVRYNGAHGEYSRDEDGHYAVPHIHYITPEEIAKGHSQPQEKYRENTNKYDTFDDALRVFFHDTSTENYLEYFPELTQGRLV